MGGKQRLFQITVVCSRSGVVWSWTSICADLGGMNCDSSLYTKYTVPIYKMLRCSAVVVRIEGQIRFSIMTFKAFDVETWCASSTCANCVTLSIIMSNDDIYTVTQLCLVLSPSSFSGCTWKVEASCFFLFETLFFFFLRRIAAPLCTTC